MSLFSSRKTSCCLIDLRSAISLGSNRDCSTTSATYPAVPRWKSRMEASSRKGAPFNSIRGAQTRAAAWWLALLSPSVADLICIVRGCLALLWGSVSQGGWFLPPSTTSFPLSSLFLLVGWINSEGLGGWRSGKLGLRSFSRCIPPRLRL